MKKKKSRIALIFGTRPEIIKLSPLIRLFESQKQPYFMVHSGQHYTYEMDRLLFKELELPLPQYRLDLRSRGPAFQSEHTGRMMAGIEKILVKESPCWVLVQGDTNTVLAGALAVSKLATAGYEMKLGHVEAGLRSYDRRMPEEINRVITDHVSDALFCPTPEAARIATREQIPAKKIFMTGNTIVDAVKQNLLIAKKKSRALKTLGLKPRGYFLMTLHRQENVDDKKRLASILYGVGKVSQDLKKEIIFPIHPRTRKRLESFGLSVPAGVRMVPPAGFLDFLLLESQAELLLTDSGGLQEEGRVLGVPCVTLRDNTERPETVVCGSNRLAGADPHKIVKTALFMARRRRNWKNVLGDGRAAQKITRLLTAV